MTVTRDWDGTSRRVRVSYGHSEPQPPDPYWTYNYSAESQYRKSGGDVSWIRDYGERRAEAAFLCAVSEDIYAHTLAPFFPTYELAIITFHDFRGLGPVSAVQALLILWLRTSEGAAQEILVDAAETCVRIVMHGFAPWDLETRQRFRVLVLNHFVSIRHRLPDGWVAGLAKRFADEDRVHERAELIELTTRIVEER